MACYVDALRDHGWRLGPSCHLVGDSPAELHALARRAGLRLAWFQASPPASTPHYDLTASRRAACVRLGAVELGRAEFVAEVRRIRALVLAGAWGAPAKPGL